MGFAIGNYPTWNCCLCKACTCTHISTHTHTHICNKKREQERDEMVEPSLEISSIIAVRNEYCIYRERERERERLWGTARHAN